MAAKKGALVLIKVGDDGEPEMFSTLGGLRTSRMIVNNQVIDSSNRESGNWQQVLANAGIQAMIIEGEGLFVDSASEETMRQNAFGQSVKNYRFYFGNGGYITGPFYVNRYEREGRYDDVEMYNLALVSAGDITFTSA